MSPILTREDAVADALGDMEDGDTITIHEKSCARVTTDDRCFCTCLPWIVKKGAKA